MREIELTQGRVATVDDADYELVSVHKWHYADYLNGRGYAKTNNKENSPALLRMHRLIMKAGPKDKVDHINGNTLDNRRENLRFVSQSQNMINAGLRSTNKSGYKGVCFVTREKKWLATIWKDGKQKYLGFHNKAEDAAKAYNEAAISLHGEYARLNPL